MLHETDISVEEGEFLVLVGPSGCGKSTLLNMIAGLEEITRRRSRIRGEHERRAPVRPQHRHGVPVLRALPEHDREGQNISFGMECTASPSPEREKAIADVAELLQISHLLDRKPGQLSGGQRQRVAMGRALVRDPDVFLFDEPLSNLDAKLRVDMRTEIKKLHQKLGTTIVYVTHDQIEALTLSTRIAVMFGGYVQQLGTPQGNLRQSGQHVRRRLHGIALDEPDPGQSGCRRITGCPAAEVSLADGATAFLPFATGKLADQIGRDIVLGIRPEAITDRDGADRNERQAVQVISKRWSTSPNRPARTLFVVSQLGGKDVTGRFRADVARQRRRNVPFAVNMDEGRRLRPANGSADRLRHEQRNAGHRHHRQRHGRRDARGRPRANRRADRDPGARSSPFPTTRRRATRTAHLRQQRLPLRRDLARRRWIDAFQNRATITMSAATRSSTARC